MLKLLFEYKDIIAWSYEQLKIYDLEIMTHDIPLKLDVKPFHQRQRPINLIIEPLIMKEVQKILDAKIIFPIRHSTWVANLVPVQKKTGEIHLCVDFCNLNLASQNDNYPLASLDEVLQIVNGSKMMSFLDGYLGYNQIMVDEEDRVKIAFTTKWGTFTYRRIPFRLINAGATFQRAMDDIFKGLINRCIVIYMDDFMVFSKFQNTHIADLKQVFNRCRKYGISLNPKKCSFRVTKGKLLGHIISEEGISIDPNRTESILKLSPPHSQK
jgi:hypothetical protein